MYKNKKNIKLQEYLNQLYPTIEEKEKVKEITTNKSHVDGGELDLSEYPNLEIVIICGSCLKSPLTNLDISNCSQLTFLCCPRNQLTNLDLSQNKKLERLHIADNNFSEQDLSMFSHLFSLENLVISNNEKEKIEQNIYNRFVGSLEPLKNLTKLNCLHISNTDINGGVDYLPSSIKQINCSFAERLTSKVKEVVQRLEADDSFHHEKVNQYKKNWKDLHPDFTYILQNLWEKHKFTHHKTKKWLDVGLKPTDYDLVNYLKGKNYKAEEIVNLAELRSEYDNNLDWKNIHPDFADKSPRNKEAYQQNWEKHLTYQDTKEWISIGFLVSSYDEVKEWKKQGFNFNQTQKWIEVGLNDWSYNLASYLSNNGFTPQQYANTSKDSQEWLDYFYPREKRTEITKLNISGFRKSDSELLTGTLCLNDFINLEELNCYCNQLSNLDLSKCIKLKKINCGANKLTNLDLSQQSELQELNCFYNPLTTLSLGNNLQLTELNCHSCRLTTLEISNCQELTKISCQNNRLTNLSTFSQLVNLWMIRLENNPLFGSCQPLQNLSKLRVLGIDNTNIKSGWEYLGEGLNKMSIEKEIPKNAQELVVYHKIASEKTIPHEELYSFYGHESGNVHYLDIQEWKGNQPAFQWLKANLAKHYPNLDPWELIREKNIFFNVKDGSYQGKDSETLCSFFLQDKIILEKEAVIRSLEKTVTYLRELIVEQQKKLTIKISNYIDQYPNEKEDLISLVKTYRELKKAEKANLPLSKIRKKFNLLYDDLEEALGEKVIENIKKDCDDLVDLDTKLVKENHLLILHKKASNININISGNVKGNLLIGNKFGEHTNINYHNYQAIKGGIINAGEINVLGEKNQITMSTTNEYTNQIKEITEELEAKIEILPNSNY